MRGQEKTVEGTNEIGQSSVNSKARFLVVLCGITFSRFTPGLVI